MQAWHKDVLVASRECGECQVCCIVPAIDKLEIQKVTNSPCRHSLCGCCDIYETRPPVCREYYCGWRQMDIFPADWRPDKSGFFIKLEADQPPPFQSMGIFIMLVGNPLKSIRQQEFIDFVARNVRSKVALFLGVPGSKGEQTARLPLNNSGIVQAATHSRTELKLALEKVLKRLQGHTFIPYVMENSGQDAST